MQFSYHVLAWRLCASLFCLLIFLPDSKSQSWIIDTPTGRLSAWIIQRHPAQPQKAELLFLNHSQESVEHDIFNTNENYLEIKSPSGLSVISRRIVLTKTLNESHDPEAEKHISWDIDLHQLIDAVDYFKNGMYSITWHMDTSFGKLSAEPIEFYFKK
ncbi:MAG: hypothetical protein AAFZ15_28300 [Bacteroidota bacterium]